MVPPSGLALLGRSLFGPILFGPVPGGVELIVVFFVLVLLFGPVVAAAFAAVKYLDRRDAHGSDERVAELETRVAELEHDDREE